MRILVVSNLYPPETIGGYEIQCSQAVEQLIARGHDVLVLTSVPHSLPPEHLGHILRVLRTPDVYSTDRSELRSPHWELESNLINPDNVYLLLEVIRQFEPDVCYLWNLVALGGAGIVGALEYIGTPWVWHLGDSVPAMLCNFEGQLVEMAHALAPRLSGRFIACSQTVVDKTERVFSLAGRVRIAPNWIMHSTGRADRSFWNGSDLKLIHAGRLTEDKGSFILLEVARILKERDIAFSLDLVGDGEVDELRRRIAELQLQDRVRLSGRLSQEDLRERLRNADLFLFPTFAEDSMPLAPLEAASVGCIPVIPLLSGISEWLIDGVDCIKCERSAVAYADAIRRVIDNEVDVKVMARRAARVAHEHFRIDRIMPTVEEELRLAAERASDRKGVPSDAYVLSLIGHAMLRRHLATHSGGFQVDQGNLSQN